MKGKMIRRVPKYSKKKYILDEIIEPEIMIVFPLKTRDHAILTSLGKRNMLMKDGSNYYLKAPGGSKIIELIDLVMGKPPKRKR